MPPHADDDDDVIIILSVVITPELAECLDRKIPSGAFGDTREEVAQGYLCRAFSVTAPAKQVPEQAAVESSDEPAPGGDDDEQ